MNIDFFFCLLALTSFSLIFVDSPIFWLCRWAITELGHSIDGWLEMYIDTFYNKVDHVDIFGNLSEKLVRCYACIGFWVGFLWLYSIQYGLVVSLFAYIIGVTMSYLKVKTLVERDNL